MLLDIVYYHVDYGMPKPQRTDEKFRRFQFSSNFMELQDAENIAALSRARYNLRPFRTPVPAPVLHLAQHFPANRTETSAGASHGSRFFSPKIANSKMITGERIALHASAGAQFIARPPSMPITPTLL
jgi:hypothetical protein